MPRDDTSSSPVMRAHRLLPVLCLLTVGCLLGVTTNLMKLASQTGVSLLSFVFWSVLGGGLVLVAVAIGKRQAPGLSVRHLEYYLFSGLVSIGLPNALSFSAVPHAGAGFVSLSMASPPIFTYLLALLLQMELFQAQRGLGMLCGLARALFWCWRSQ